MRFAGDCFLPGSVVAPKEPSWYHQTMKGTVGITALIMLLWVGESVEHAHRAVAKPAIVRSVQGSSTADKRVSRAFGNAATSDATGVALARTLPHETSTSSREKRQCSSKAASTGGARCFDARTGRPRWLSQLGQVMLWPVATAMRLLWTPAAMMVSWVDRSGLGVWVRRRLNGQDGRFVPILDWQTHRRVRAGGRVSLWRLRSCDRCRLDVAGWGGGRRVFGGWGVFAVDVGKNVALAVASGADERDDLWFHAAPWAETGPYGFGTGRMGVYDRGVMLWRRHYEVDGTASWHHGPWLVAGGLGWRDFAWGLADGGPSSPIPATGGSSGLGGDRSIGQDVDRPLVWPWSHTSGLVLRLGIGYQAAPSRFGRIRSGAFDRFWRGVRSWDRRHGGLGARLDLWWFGPGRSASTVRATADLWYSLPVGARALLTAWVEVAYQPALASRQERLADRSLSPAEWPAVGGGRLLRGWRDGTALGPFVGFASLEYRRTLPFGFEVLAFFDWAQVAGQDLEGWNWRQGLWSFGARLEWVRLGVWAPYIQVGMGQHSWLCSLGLGRWP